MTKVYPLNWHYENELNTDGRALIGVDEVGRGPLAGPVISAAVIMPKVDSLPFRLTDSKKLSQGQREIAFDWIVSNCRYRVSGASAREIEKLNILHASLLAMKRSLAGLEIDQRHQHLALIDGNKAPRGARFDCRTLVKGDTLSPSIAAASIVAKVIRDRLMRRLDLLYPVYGFARHKGYPTKAHREALAAVGATHHHRRTYAPVAALSGDLLGPARKRSLVE